MRVIGTAGHVDHGKSTLVRALTGIDPDRLAEEKAREMTIDLGFAWLKLANGETIGLVDVPGHRDFIENMLAGVGGIDAVLLVIAADEGVMPQTREHLAILDLLGIQNGLVVLSKTDMVDDPDWLDLIEHDIRQVTASTSLATAHIVRVSARTGAGLAALQDALVALLQIMPDRQDYNHPRLPIDRVFTISGFGSVVTGTLMGGSLHVGDEVELQPSALRARIRGLQSYNQAVESAEPGSRVAVNLAGVEKRSIVRGSVLTHPGQLWATTMVDVHFRHLKDAERPLKHNAQVKCFVGAAESVGYVRLLSDDVLQPGHEGWVQIRLESPMAVAQGDRFILRYPSPSQTIGGGVIVNPHPERRWRRFQADVIAVLETQMAGSPAERVAQAAQGREPVKRTVLQKQTGYSDAELDAAIAAALADGRLVDLGEGLYLAMTAANGVWRQMRDVLAAFHAQFPLRLGMPQEELRSKLGLKAAFFNKMLEAQNRVLYANGITRLTEHHIVFTPVQQAAITRLMDVLQAAPYTPPSFAEAAQIVSDDVVYALIDLGEIVQVQADVIFAASVYAEMVSEVLRLIDEQGSIAANALRDRFQTTRKYAIGLLEHLDALNITRRSGDSRVRGTRRP